MSNISRRDFLKTAGVMTLAVAAAGVLAGCEADPVIPETGVKELGEISKIGDFEFSVVKVAQQNNVTKTLKEGEVIEKTVTLARPHIMISVRNAGKKPTDTFDFSKVNVYMNGEKITTFKGGALGKDDAKKIMGVDKDIAAMPSNATAMATTVATNYNAFFDLEKDAFGEDFKAINSLEVVYYDSDDNSMVTYKVPTPLTVVEYETIG